MNALSNFKSAIGQSSHVGIIALISLIPVIVPHLALAAELQTSSKQNQIFEIKVSDPNITDQTPKPNDQNLLTIQTIQDNDPLVIALKQFLNDNDSPLGEYAPEIVKQPQWQRALAISYVE